MRKARRSSSRRPSQNWALTENRSSLRRKRQRARRRRGARRHRRRTAARRLHRRTARTASGGSPHPPSARAAPPHRLPAAPPPTRPAPPPPPPPPAAPSSRRRLRLRLRSSMRRRLRLLRHRPRTPRRRRRRPPRLRAASAPRLARSACGSHAAFSSVLRGPACAAVTPAPSRACGPLRRPQRRTGHHTCSDNHACTDRDAGAWQHAADRGRPGHRPRRTSWRASGCRVTCTGATPAPVAAPTTRRHAGRSARLPGRPGSGRYAGPDSNAGSRRRGDAAARTPGWCASCGRASAAGTPAPAHRLRHRRRASRPGPHRRPPAPQRRSVVPGSAAATPPPNRAQNAPPTVSRPSAPRRRPPRRCRRRRVRRSVT